MNIHTRHCYIDDAESQLYLMMQQVRKLVISPILLGADPLRTLCQILYSSGGISRFETMENLHEKELFWDDTDVPLNGVSPNRRM